MSKAKFQYSTVVSCATNFKQGSIQSQKLRQRSRTITDHSYQIQKSKELLLHNPQMQIKEIAYLAGFEDANYFCTVFKKQELLGLNQFRRIHS
ncbi:helix-turn-helix domain-containing protein [Paenibacillus sp. FSL R5-0623]|uniref:helix-turn-helix domain-containing protein n=1 Tax=Paenibacillus sp. FSL R5-0623 TaxID=2921651 RepID=UPI0030DC0E5F